MGIVTISEWVAGYVLYKRERKIEADYLQMKKKVQVLEEGSESYTDTVLEIEGLKELGSRAVIRLNFWEAGHCYSFAGGRFLALGGTDNLKHAAESFATAGRFYKKANLLVHARESRRDSRAIRQELALRRARGTLEGEILMSLDGTIF